MKLVRVFYLLKVYRYLKTFIIMSNHRILFYGEGASGITELECFSNHNTNKITIAVKEGKKFIFTDIDISTAIKFSKTLRTEINKAKEDNNV